MTSAERTETIDEAEAHIGRAVDHLVRALGIDRATDVAGTLLATYLERHRHARTGHARIDWDSSTGRALAGAQ